MTSVELPSGVAHNWTHATAESWEAYDALTAEDGWAARGEFARWKENRIREHLIIVFEPHEPREMVAA